jgi:hypothetical protein
MKSPQVMDPFRKVPHAVTEATLRVGGSLAPTANDVWAMRFRVELWYYVLLVICGVFGYLQWLPNWILVGGISLVAFRRFWKDFNNGVALMPVAALLAIVQWLIGPLWFYIGNYTHQMMGMQVDEPTYFSLAVPGTAAYALGLLVIGQTVPLRPVLKAIETGTLLLPGGLLLMVSFGADLAARFAPTSLAYFFHLLSQLRYVGVLYFLASPGLTPKLLAVVAVFPLFVNSAASAMFHDLILWIGILLSFWFARVARSQVFKGMVIVLVAAGVFTIQGIKGSFREKVWSGQEASLGGHLVDFWTHSFSANPDEILEGALYRFNQGWIVSHVQTHVPLVEPYARGSTLKDALVAALLPRFFYKEKGQAGGRTNFIRFTGLELNENTAMTISLLGEGYANFGRAGGALFLLLTGLTMAGSYVMLLRWTRQHSLFLLWLPMIYYQAIKAETDLTEILNHVVKGTIVAVTVFILLEIVCPTRQVKRASTLVAE